MVYPIEAGEKAGKPITDWEGNIREGEGVVFYNYADTSWQAVAASGLEVIIINLVDEEKARLLDAKIKTFAYNPAELSIKNIKQILKYAFEELGLGDRYNSDIKTINTSVIPIGQKEVANYGLYKKNGDICHAVYIRDAVSFQGPAATLQEYDNGAVIIKQKGSIHALLPKIFAETYLSVDDKPITKDDVVDGTMRARIGLNRNNAQIGVSMR